MWKTIVSITKYEVVDIRKILKSKEGDRFWEIEMIVLSKAM
jgi:hypothetical protein